MSRRRTAARLFPIGALLTAALFIACGGGGPSTATPTAVPIASSPTSTPATEGSPAAAACPIDLATESPDSVIYGADSGDFLADRFSLATGDFNGDGFDDVLIGSPLADGPDNSRLNGGEAYVIFGSSSPPDTIDLADGADVTIYGGAPNDNLGLTLASGDFNGDGIDDILVGARFATHEEQTAVGKTYVVYGDPDLSGVVDTGRGQEDVTIAGRDTGDLSGGSLGSGDVTGDGVDDIIIGAFFAGGPDNDRQRAGEAYVIRGSSDLSKLIDLGSESPFFTVYGANPTDQVPNYIAAGDVNDDGRDDLILGAPFADKGITERPDVGEVYIIAVPEDGGSLDLASGLGFTRITGADARDGFGHFTAAGDVNGDGIDDAVIGARNADGPEDGRNNAGEVHVLLGHPQLPESVDLATDTLDATIIGPDAGDSLGFTVAIGDLNGDGIDDILAGAPVADSCGNKRSQGGDAYAVFGRPDLSGDIDLADDEYDLSLFGAEPSDELGFSLTSGDINGDGKDDVIVGALLARGPENRRADAGEAYIILSP